MSVLAVLGLVFKPIVDVVGGYINHKMEVVKMERQGEITRLQTIQEQEGEWNIEQARASASSWKDEYLTLVLTIPMIGCFVPFLAPYVMRGFEILASTPLWYQGAIGVMVAASFGIQSYAKIMEHKNGTTNAG